MPSPSTPKTVSAYIAAAPSPARGMLRQLRAAIRSAAPKAQESISYGMPYYSFHGRLTYFAAFRDHVSLFVWGPVLKRYAAEIRKYQTSRATLRFPIGTRIPVALVKKLVTARRKENEEAAKAKKKR
jgi:uncharacterized protein YdhG (YjbR/CyaY superfamily)